MNALSRLVLAALLVALAPSAWADRVKDLANVATVRSNQLIGYGLVVGLQGTGDGADVSFTAQSLRALLSRLGVTTDGQSALETAGFTPSDFTAGAGAGKMDIKNVAAVMVTADLPGMAKPGQRIDVNVSAIGRATNLRGGNLLLTAMRGTDGEVYAVAQGALTATGIDQSAAGSRVAVGVPTAARIPGGASVEREVENPFDKADHIVLNLREADFTTNTAIVEAINRRFGSELARPLDGTSIAVRAPADIGRRVAFISTIENLDINPGDPPARVIVNARTGTVVISRNVRVTPSAVSHGTISVAITATNEISQPGAPLTQGQTAAVQNAQVAVTEPNKPMFLFQPGVDLRQVVEAVNQVGATPSALIAILEGLKGAGSLRAELIVQ
jgi:flagellar P-ring protein precursor FlgI